MADEVKPKIHTGPNGERLVETGETRVPKKDEFYRSHLGRRRICKATCDYPPDNARVQILRPATPEEAEAAEREPEAPMVSAWMNREVVATVALDGGTQRACNNPDCGQGYEHQGPCDTYFAKAAAAPGISSRDHSNLTPDQMTAHSGRIVGMPHPAPAAPPPSPQSAKHVAGNQERELCRLLLETAQRPQVLGETNADNMRWMNRIMTQFVAVREELRLSSGKGEPGPVCPKCGSAEVDFRTDMSGPLWISCEGCASTWPDTAVLAEFRQFFPYAPSPQRLEFLHRRIGELERTLAAHVTRIKNQRAEINRLQSAAPSPQPERDFGAELERAIKGFTDTVHKRTIPGLMTALEMWKLPPEGTAQPPDPEALAHPLEMENTELRLKILDADKMAAVADDWVRRGVIDARSALADARLNYGKPYVPGMAEALAERIAEAVCRKLYPKQLRRIGEQFPEIRAVVLGVLRGDSAGAGKEGK